MEVPGARAASRSARRELFGVVVEGVWELAVLLQAVLVLVLVLIQGLTLLVLVAVLVLVQGLTRLVLAVVLVLVQGLMVLVVLLVLLLVPSPPQQA